MRTLAIAIVISCMASAAFAQTNCYAVGSQWICNGQGYNSNSYQIGNQTITNGTVRDPYTGQTRNFTRSCYWVGSQYICN